MAKILMIQVQAAPYAGTAYLHSAARTHGHEFVLHLGSDLDPILRCVRDEQPDLIGFSCMSSLYSQILPIARRIKQQFSTPIILGGPHPSFFPDVIHESCFDMICIGEGEFALIELLDALERKQSFVHIRNLWVKSGGTVHKNELRPLIDPLDDAPLIDWSCYAGIPVQYSPPIAFLIRGCPYACSYCFNETMLKLYEGKGKYVRHFSVERSIQEIQQAFKVFTRNPVVFTSDSFGLDLPWMDVLLKRYTELTDLPFVLLLRPELVTEPCVEILAKYKCHCVAIGVESGSERVRRDILNRRYSNKLLVEVAERLHSRGIRLRTYNMIGIPTETKEEVWETIDVNVKMKTDFPRGAILTPMPGTKIVQIAKERGYLDDDFLFEDLPTTILSHSVMKKIDHSWIQNMLFLFQTAIVLPWTRPLIRQLARLKPNVLFHAWFYLVYGYLHMRSEGRSLLSYASYVFANRKYL